MCRKINSCDWCGSVAGLQPSQHALRALLDGDRVDPVVAPGAVDVQEPRRVARPRGCPSFSTTRSELVFSGRIAISIRCSPAVKKQWSIAIATARGIDAAAGVLLVDPVADRGELRRAAHDVVDRDLAGEPAVDLDRERDVVPGRAMPVQPPDQLRGTSSAGRRRRAGRSRPTASARRRCGCRASRHAAVRRSSASGRSVTSPAVSRAGQPAQWSLPTICSTACTSIGSSTAEPVLHAAARAGQVDDQAAAGDAGQPARQRRGRDALGDAVRADRLGDAGHLAVEQRPGHLGRPVGRGEAGAAGGEHDPGAAVDGGRDRLRRPARRRARRPASSTVEARAAAGTRRSAARSRRRRPRPRPGWTRRRPRRAGSSSSPGPVAGLAAGLGLDPDVGDHRALVDRLDHVDDGERRRPRPRSAPPSRRRCGRWCARSRVISTASSATARSTVTPEIASGWHSGISDGVCLAPMIPASRATAERVALGHALAAQQRDHLGARPAPGRTRWPSGR